MCWGQVWGLGGMELWVGSKIMIIFFVYIAASFTAHVLYIFGVYIHCWLLYIYYICITCVNIITFDYFVLT